MSANSKIEWCTHTFNVAWGCVESSPGCDHCYARVLAKRYGYDWGPGAERRVMSEAYWNEPLKWDARAAKTGIRERVFCSSMTDVFLNDPVINSQRARLYNLIERTRHLDWLLLTKHAERLSFHAPVEDDGSPARNVWLGVSVESNEYAWRVDRLRKAPATVRFLSVEPMLGTIDEVSLEGIGWVICGGESGPLARPMHQVWALELRDRCVDAGIPFFFKQWGEYQPLGSLLGLVPITPMHNGQSIVFYDGEHVKLTRNYELWPSDDRWRTGRGEVIKRVGKAKAGRILGGREWSEFPKVGAA